MMPPEVRSGSAGRNQNIPRRRTLLVSTAIGALGAVALLLPCLAQLQPSSAPAAKKVAAGAGAARSRQTLLDLEVLAAARPADEEFVGPFASWANARSAYGARGDGVTDDTPALQRALDDLGSPGHSQVLFLPAGTYLISRTLTMTSQIHVSVIGENPETTVIRWDGPSDGDMLYANGVRYSRWARLTWDGAGRARCAISHGWDGKVQGAATGNEHADEVFRNLQFGIRGGTRNRMDAETTVLRCRFLRCSRAGVSLESWNALDWFIRYSEFRDCGIGVTNEFGSGNFNVYDSMFRNSSVADVTIRQTLLFSLRRNLSIGSRKFFVARNAGQNSAQMTLQQNDVIDFQESPAVDVQNLGPLALIDNLFRSLENQAGPVVRHETKSQGAELVSAGNTFTVSAPISAAGPEMRSQTMDDRVIPREEAVVRLPGVLESEISLPRMVYDVQPGSDAADIQAVIDDAALHGGDRPVIHLPAGNYAVNQTIVFPAKREIQAVGDGYLTRLIWTGKYPGPILRLRGPSHVTLRELSLRGEHDGDGLLVEEADQPGAMFQGHQIYGWGASRYNVLAEDLNNTQINLLYHIHGQSGLASVRVTGGQRPGGSRVALLGAASGDESSSAVVYDVGQNGTLVVQDAWHEGHNRNFVLLRDGGVVAFQNVRAATYSKVREPTVYLQGFRGRALFFNMLIDGPIRIEDLGKEALVMAVGVESHTADPFRRVGASGLASFIHGHVYGSDGSRPVANGGDPAAADLFRRLLEPVRESGAPEYANLPLDVTNVRLYRVAVEQPITGIRIISGRMPE